MAKRNFGSDELCEQAGLLRVKMIIEKPQIYELGKLHKREENSGKCKQLFSNIPILWENSEVFFSGYEIENCIIYITKCTRAEFFLPEVLRRSFLLRADMTPSLSLAISQRGNEVFARGIYFDLHRREKECIASLARAITNGAF